jgi:hypothetical protein
MTSNAERYNELLIDFASNGELDLGQLRRLLDGLEPNVVRGPGGHSDLSAPLGSTEELPLLADVSKALAVIETDDPAHPWNLGAVLFRAGRYLDAANEYLVAAGRFRQDAEAGTGSTGDEDDWAQTSLYHAARSFLRAGMPISAAAVSTRMNGAERTEVLRELRANVTRRAAENK